MKKILLLSSALILILFGCQKDNDLKTSSSDDLTINGIRYPTVEIGGRIWMATNYDDNTGTKPQIDSLGYSGKLYTISQMKAIIPPVGWRIPNKDDFLSLVKATKGEYWENTDNKTYIEADNHTAISLMSTQKWLHGKNTIGFNALPTEIIYNQEERSWIYICTFWCSNDAFSIFDINDWSAEGGGGANLTHYSAIPPAGSEWYNASTKASIRFVRDK